MDPISSIRHFKKNMFKQKLWLFPSKTGFLISRNDKYRVVDLKLLKIKFITESGKE